MDSNNIHLLVRFLSLIMTADVFGIIFALAFSGKPVKLWLNAYEEFRGYLSARRYGVLDYGKAERFLKKNGAEYHFGKWMEPLSFTAVRITAGGMGLLTGSYFGLLYGLLLGTLFFFLPNILLVYLNNKDNERLLPELKLVYQALAIQIKAGVYITDALAECYGSVQEERLRMALLELSGDIVMKSDMDDALEQFQEKFDNRYVDSLCITIIQAMESGQAISLLADIAEQIKDMEEAVMSRKKSALDRSITFYQLGILCIILAIVLYACIAHMFAAADIF